MQHTDVVVCGAGISGLLLASELSKTCSVIVLERNSQPQCSNKFWLTERTALEENPSLSNSVDSEWGEMNFISNSRATFTAKGRYVLWHTKKLESTLIEKIRANGSKVLYNTRFYSYQYCSDSVVSFANTLRIKSKIIVDCMGCASPIVRSSSAIQILGYHHLYGRTMELSKPITPVAVDNVILSGTPSYLEVFPRSDGHANVVLIQPAKYLDTPSHLIRDFNFIVSASHYSEHLKDVKANSPLFGTVPIGKVKRTALDRIVFFGESGQIHPAASCTCLNKSCTPTKS